MRNAGVQSLQLQVVTMLLPNEAKLQIDAKARSSRQMYGLC